METYSLGNQFINRTWAFNKGKLYTISIKNVKDEIEYVHTPIEENDFSYEGLTHETLRFYNKNPYEFTLNQVKEEVFDDNIYTAGGKKLTFSLVDCYHGLEISYIATLFNDCPAIKVTLEINAFNMPEWYFFEKRYNVIDTCPVALDGFNITSYEFFTRTDYTNDLIQEKNDAIGFDKGNIIFATDENHGLFFLKESPVFSDSRPECYGHFYIAESFISTIGTGIMPHEFVQRKMSTYSSVVGVFNGCQQSKYVALKNYQSKASHYYPMILANPWGSRKWMEHINEPFVVEEIKAVSRLGAEYYQLDDGWNEGFGLIHVGYSKKMDKQFWDIKKDIFPNGFHQIKQVAKEHNIELALWLGLDCNCMYRNYLEQADIIYDMYRTYGIKVFKIDIMKLRSYESEENIEKLFRLLREKSNGEIIFNLDVTADKRSGYFMFNEYGIIFLENRYDIADNYKPYLTLKNQWDLANYIPLQNLQIEFLNVKENDYDHEYMLGITLFANPLCWFEPSGLSDEIMNVYQHVLSIYKGERNAIQRGAVMAIGDRPDNKSYTGFISYNGDERYCYLLLFRENNEEGKYTYTVDLLKDKKMIEIEYILNSKYGNMVIENERISVFFSEKRSMMLVKLKWGL
ncbi:MAG: alpha-galactosidase [Clostridia bacterium]|nr:alpha-galactosidase [Clostridia bacterium]